MGTVTRGTRIVREYVGGKWIERKPAAGDFATCPACGRIFTLAHGNQAYCSLDCREIAKELRLKFGLNSGCGKPNGVGSSKLYQELSAAMMERKARKERDEIKARLQERDRAYRAAFPNMRTVERRDANGKRVITRGYGWGSSVNPLPSTNR